MDEQIAAMRDPRLAATTKLPRVGRRARHRCDRRCATTPPLLRLGRSSPIRDRAT